MEWSKVLREGFVLPWLGSVSLPHAISSATHAVAEHLLHSEAVRLFLRDIPKGKGTNCPDSPLDEIIKYVAIQRAEIDKSDPALNLAFMKAFVMPVFGFEREEVLNALWATNDVKPEDHCLIHDASYLASRHNNLWARWFEEIVVPYQSLDKAGKKKYEEVVRGTLSQWDYTVFDFDPEHGIINRRTWASAFPGEIRAILHALVPLTGGSYDRTFREYFKAFSNAYGCTKVLDLEALWAEVDRRWIEIPIEACVISVHGMESGYEHPFGVSPEFRIEIRTPKAHDLIEMRRKATVAHAEAFGLSSSLVDIARQKLDRIDISVFVNAIRSGVDLNFRLAGQAVPNRQEVLALGGKIFVDDASPGRSVELYLGYLKKHCTKESFEALKSFITAENLLNHTVIHEFSHPVGCTPLSDKAIGGSTMKLLEEGKATFLGIIADVWSDSSEENRLEVVALTVARLIRFMTRTTLENETSAPYVRENLVAATTLFESGVARLTPEGISIDIEKAKSSVWFVHLEDFCRGVLAAYRDHNKHSLELLTDRYCDMTHDLHVNLIKWVNRD